MKKWIDARYLPRSPKPRVARPKVKGCPVCGAPRPVSTTTWGRSVPTGFQYKYHCLKCKASSAPGITRKETFERWHRDALRRE